MSSLLADFKDFDYLLNLSGAGTIGPNTVSLSSQMWDGLCSRNLKWVPWRRNPSFEYYSALRDAVGNHTAVLQYALPPKALEVMVNKEIEPVHVSNS